METYKRNQVEEAVCRTLGAQGEREKELKFRIKRLLALDRKLGVNTRSVKADDRHFAFYSQKKPGRGVEVMFSAYEAFALLAAIMLLEHGLPQAGVVRVMRRIRWHLEVAHEKTLNEDPTKIFDQGAIRAQATAGMMATNNTKPVFLVFVRLTGSEVDPRPDGSPVAVCQGSDEYTIFWNQYFASSVGVTVFEFVRQMWDLKINLLNTRPARRGPAARR